MFRDTLRYSLNRSIAVTASLNSGRLAAIDSECCTDPSVRAGNDNVSLYDVRTENIDGTRQS